MSRAKPEDRVAEIVEPDLRPDPCRLGGLCHLQRIRRQRGQRLFAMHMLACRDGRQRHLLVERVGGGDVHHVDLGVLDQGPPVIGGVGEAELRRRPLRSLDGDIGQRVHPEPDRQVEDPRRGGIGKGVGHAHEARADQADIEFRFRCHRHAPCSPRAPDRSGLRRSPRRSVPNRSPFARPRLRSRPRYGATGSPG